MARDYKKEYADYHGKPDQIKQRAERVKAQRMVDKTGKDANGNGKADAREGKDIDHKKPLRAGGKSTKDNLRIRSIKANRGDNGK
jgi:hypothetical protein